MSLKEQEFNKKLASLQETIRKYRAGSTITRIMIWDNNRYLIEAPATYPDTGNPYYILDNDTLKPFTPTIDFAKFDYARNHVVVRAKSKYDDKIGD